MNKLLLALPLVTHGATLEPASDIVYGGRWATIVIETQFMLMADKGLITPDRLLPAVRPTIPLRPIALKPMERTVTMDDLRPTHDSAGGLPDHSLPNIKRKIGFMSIGRK